MDAAAHWFEVGTWASLGLAVLMLLLRQQKACAGLFCLAFLFVGVYRIADALALRARGLGREFGGRTSHIVSIAARPTETALSFWVNLLVGAVISGIAILVMLAYASSLRARDKIDAGMNADEASRGNPESAEA